MKRIALTAVLFFSFLDISRTQQPTLDWSASFHKSYSFAYSMSKDNLGNIFICGYHLPNYVRSKYLTLKFGSNGVFNWASFYQGLDTFTLGTVDVALKNIADRKGNVYVAGRSLNNTNGSDIVLIKYNTLGDSIWTVRYNGPGNAQDEFSDMVMDKYSNIYITSYSAGLPATGLDYLTLKYDSSGNKLWEARYNNIFNSTDEPKSIAIDSLLNVFVTGYCRGSNSKNEYVTIKYNPSGAQQWVSKYSTNADAEAMNVGVDRQNNIYVTGKVDTMITPSILSKYRTIKYDSSGNEIWAREFKRMYFTDIPYNILIDSFNSPVIAGTSIVKYNSDGLFLWADTVSPGWYACALDKMNNLYVSGSRTDSSFNWYMKTIKYSLTGDKLWTINIGGTENYNYTPAEILIDNNDIYIAANFEINGQNGFDSIVLFKYSQPIGITSNYNQIPERFYLYQNFPNPFNPVTKIYYTLPVSGNVKIEIYDLLGQKIQTLQNEFKEIGSYIVDFDGSNLSSGLYFYRIESGSYVETKKMLLIK